MQFKKKKRGQKLQKKAEKDRNRCLRTGELRFLCSVLESLRGWVSWVTAQKRLARFF